MVQAELPYFERPCLQNCISYKQYETPATELGSREGWDEGRVEAGGIHNGWGRLTLNGCSLPPIISRSNRRFRTGRGPSVLTPPTALARLIWIAGAWRSPGRPRRRASLVQGHSASEVTDGVGTPKCSMSRTAGQGCFCRLSIGLQLSCSPILPVQNAQFSTLLSSEGFPASSLPHLKCQQRQMDWH